MLESPPDCLTTEVGDVLSAPRPAAVDRLPREPLALPLMASAVSAALAACGGSSDGGGAQPPSPPPITEQQAARFLTQASLGGTREHIASVRALGYAGWLDAQFAMPLQGTRWDWLIAAGYGAEANRNSQAGFDSAMWRKLLTAPDTLRQRITLALSEMLVVSIEGLVGGGWKAFAAAGYTDLLEAHAFGIYRELLQQVSLSPAMGSYLTFRGNVKADTAKGSSPDENYARELMQLFTLGLYELNLDGSLKLSGGNPKETYVQADVTELARVFTGWDLNKTTSDADHPQQYQREPMAQVAGRYETGAKSFLGTTIAAGTDAAACLAQALDAICAHANVAPFVSRQLIQRLVTSNPSAAYVARVAAVFNNNGSGVQGDLKAVIKAILLDDEARNDAHLLDPAFGKLREPMLRFVA